MFRAVFRAPRVPVSAIPGLRGSWTRRAAAGTVVLGVLATLAGTPTAAQAATRALVAPAGTPVTTSAFDLIGSVGVNTHLYYSDTSYADTDRVQALLHTLGVRNIRDGLAPGRPDEVADLQQLAAAGIRSELILSGTAGPAVDPSQLSELAQVAPGTDAVEPSNEYDCSGDAAWSADLRRYSQSLVGALQTSAATSNLGVFGPSFCQPGSVAAYGSISGTASVANAHDYSGGQAPELALESRLPAFAASAAPGLPMVVTETGFTNATASPARIGVSEQTAAAYTLRSLLDDRRLGVARTYLYELMDEKPDSTLTDPEQHYGLVRADGSVKPAFTAVANLLTDAAQGSPWSVTGPSGTAVAPVTITGGGSLLRSLAIADPSGTGQTLALWLAVPLENTTTHQAISTPAQTVRLQLGGATTATSRLPAGTNAVTSLGTATRFDVPVTGAVTLVHLAPAATATTTACTTRPGYPAVAGSLGAIVASDLAPGAGWSGAPAGATDLPGDLTTGTQVTADGQQLTVPVAKAPANWTVTVWERSDAGSASYATFLQAAGAAGALLRTYDLTDDVPSHMQLSAYGLPTAGAAYGTETWGSARPGTWHLLSLTSTAGAMSFAVDGVVQGTVASGGRPLTGVTLGALGAGFRGALSGLRVFGSALSSSQVLTLATAGAASCS